MKTTVLIAAFALVTAACGGQKPSIEMVKIEPGTFIMGSPEDEAGRSTIENRERQHQVTLTRGFYMAQAPITQTQYEAVMGENPSLFQGDINPPAEGETASLRPVESVTWFDAAEFCNRLSRKEGLTPVYTISARVPETGFPITAATVTADWSANGYRLPTEAEWEYAARAGTTTAFYTGDAITQADAWFGDDLMTGIGTHEVRKKPANPWGLFDMHGNVFEWVWDRYAVYTESAGTDPTGPTEGPNRVDRGGSWEVRAEHLRSATRGNVNPAWASANTGFRVARNAE